MLHIFQYELCHKIVKSNYSLSLYFLDIKDMLYAGNIWVKVWPYITQFSHLTVVWFQGHFIKWSILLHINDTSSQQKRENKTYQHIIKTHKRPKAISCFWLGVKIAARPVMCTLSLWFNRNDAAVSSTTEWNGV